MGEANQEVLLDDELVEGDFNGALASLQKSLESDTGGKVASVQKAMSEKEPEPEDEDESEEDESEEEDEEMDKSIPEILAEDPEAAVAIDVEPFLRQLAKAVDETMTALKKSVSKRLAKIERMTKSQSEVLLHAARLEKSTNDILVKIGGQPVSTGSVRTLAKSRFEVEGEVKDFDNREVLAKSRDWSRERKIDLVEAGKIEGRINKGLLGKVGDALDHKVANLMKEGK